MIDLVPGGANGSRVCNAWLVDGLLVDPSGDPWGRTPAFWLTYCRLRGVRAIALTHWHADHATGAEALARAAGVPLFAPPGRDGFFARVSEGVAVQGRFVAIETPGHAADHVCYWDPSTRTLVAGDALDPPNVGAAGPDAAETAARLAALRPVNFLPGHGSAKFHT